MSDDPELEAFLRSFRPRAPAPLPIAGRQSTSAWWWVAAVVFLAALGLLPWPRRPPIAPTKAAVELPVPLTVGGLGGALRRGNLEATLDAMDASVLPDPRRPGGALAVLGDISRDQ
jgi:hypothetical protein